MEVSANVDSSSHVQAKETAGKKRTVVSPPIQSPKKISVSSLKATTSSSALAQVSTESYQMPPPRLVTVGSPVTLFVMGEPPRFPFAVGGQHFVIPSPAVVDTNANNNGVHLLFSPPITAVSTSTEPVSTFSSQTKPDKQHSLREIDIAKSLKEFQECPLDVDEHFRRSLAHVPGYKEFQEKEESAKKNSKAIEDKAKKLLNDYSDFNHSEMMTAPESVDDHFARALGKDWTKLSKLTH